MGCELKKKLRLGFQRRRLEFCSVFRDFNSKIQRLLKTHIVNLSYDRIKIIKDELVALRHCGDV